MIKFARQATLSVASMTALLIALVPALNAGATTLPTVVTCTSGNGRVSVGVVAEAGSLTAYIVQTGRLIRSLTVQARTGAKADAYLDIDSGDPRFGLFVRHRLNHMTDATLIDIEPPPGGGA